MISNRQFQTYDNLRKQQNQLKESALEENMAIDAMNFKVKQMFGVSEANKLNLPLPPYTREIGVISGNLNSGYSEIVCYCYVGDDIFGVFFYRTAEGSKWNLVSVWERRHDSRGYLGAEAIKTYETIVKFLKDLKKF